MLAPIRFLGRAPARSFAAAAGKEKICMVGSGNFGSALVRILGRNALKHDIFDNEVKMYVHEEMIDGKPLTQIINETNENVKYLKGAKFTPNVVADPDISSAVSGATMVCFCLPHQFLKPIMPKIKVHALPPRPLVRARALSCPLRASRRSRSRQAQSCCLQSRALTSMTKVRGAAVALRGAGPTPDPAQAWCSSPTCCVRGSTPTAPC